jgi:hypothetical protein
VAAVVVLTFIARNAREAEPAVVRETVRKR